MYSFDILEDSEELVVNRFGGAREQHNVIVRYGEVLGKRGKQQLLVFDSFLLHQKLRELSEYRFGFGRRCHGTSAYRGDHVIHGGQSGANLR